MIRKGLGSAVILSMLMAVSPAHAELQIEDIVVNQSAPQAENTNLRVNLFNSGPKDRRGSFSLRLYARKSEQDPWSLLKTWQLDGLAKGRRLSRDYFPLAEGYLDPVLAGRQYQLRAVINGPDQRVISEHQDSFEGPFQASR